MIKDAQIIFTAELTFSFTVTEKAKITTMIRHKRRSFPSKNSAFLAREQWQYTGNAYTRLSQVCLLKLTGEVQPFVTFTFHENVNKHAFFLY